MYIFYIVFSSFLTLVCCDLTSTTDHWGIYHTPQLIVVACEQLIGKSAIYFPFEDVNGFCNVHNQPALGTMATCLRMSNSTKAINVFLNDCFPKTGLTIDQFTASYINASSYLTNTTADSTFNVTEIYNKPVLLSQYDIDAAVQSIVQRYLNFNYGNIFGLVLISYWFLMILLSGFWKLLIFMIPGVLKLSTGTFINKFRFFITLPATFNNHHSNYHYLFKVFPILIPTRIETIMIGCWLILVLAFNVCDYGPNEGNEIWVLKFHGEGRLVADRCALQAMFLLPTVFLFSGRNNILQYVSGWHYSRFVLIHKWTARVLTLLCIIHGGTLGLGGPGYGKYKFRSQEPIMRWGLVALLSMSMISIQAMNILRKHRYELFLFCHIILAVIVLIGGYMHTSAFNYQQFFIAAMAIWVLDRIIRLIRMSLYGIRTAIIELVANETVKVTVSRPKYWKPFPGAHAFVYFFKPTMFWQSHPFTVVDSFETLNTITFYVKVKGGMTHGLMQYLSNIPGQKTFLKVCVEGPYGKSIPLKKYQSNIFISSGNGIPGLYSQARDLVNHRKHQQNIKFIWIIRHFKSIEWFYKELANLSALVNTTVYVTNGSEGITPFWSEQDQQQVVDEKTIIDGADQIVSKLQVQFPHITFVQQRPNINLLVTQCIKECVGTTALATCCHASIDDAIRKAVVHNLSHTTKRIDLYDQIQQW